MVLAENPVLGYELVANLRKGRAFVLQFCYVAALAAAVWLAWPQQSRLSVGSPVVAQRLFNIFFLGQLGLVAMMAPSFAAGAITGEKERKTYELLLCSPMPPAAVLWGKLLSSLCYLTLLIMSSAPLMVLCWLLGGIGLNEVAMSYAVLFLAAGTFGLISLAASSYFTRTAASLVVSYLFILPLALICIWVWLAASEEFRVFAGIVLLPPICLALWLAIGSVVSRRLLYPPDVGSEGKEVVDEEQEQEQAVGLVIHRDRFPDRLFAPSKRTVLLSDRANPVLDKELRSEIFSQGTLMLRLVIQISMLLSIPLMAVFLFFQPQWIGYYVCYVIAFNMLVGPVFSAGSVTQERERQTLEMLVTTLLRPRQIIFAKLIASLRVSTVLTLLLTEQIVLAWFMVEELRSNAAAILWYFAVILATCLVTSTVGLFCSVLCRKTTGAMILTYLVVLALFLGPIGTVQFLLPFTELTEAQICMAAVTSPFGAIFSVPLNMPGAQGTPLSAFLAWPVYRYYLGFALVTFLALVLAMDALFRLRWRFCAG